jgi:hypothetical protein
MFTTKLKLLTAFVVAVCAVTLGGSAVPYAAAQDRKKAAEPKDGTTAKGKLAAVDADKQTVTITVSSFDRKTAESTETNKTYPVAKDAKILQDETQAKLADLKKGFPTNLKLDGTTAVSISVDGGTAQGEFRTANVERNTITVIAGRDMKRNVYHLLKDAKVLGEDGKPMRVQDLKSGTKLQITRSVEDGNTAVRVQVLPAPKEDR